MLFIGKEIEDLDEKDLNSLITNSVTEKKNLDYKSQFGGNSDREKKEFLADVSSFANTIGGHLIYGIMDVKGIASDVKGITIDDEEQEILRIEAIIQNGVSPRIPQIKSVIVPLSSGKKIYILQIPKSWLSPHMVSFKGMSKFYSRNSSGKFQLDVTEIRDAFLLNQTLNEKIREFRLNRISKIISGEVPVPYSKEHTLLIHSIPLISFQSKIELDLNEDKRDFQRLNIVQERVNGAVINIDGIVSYLQFMTNEIVSYNQFFRNGIIEIVDGYFFKKENGERIIRDEILEIGIVRGIKNILKFNTNKKIQPPYYIFISLLNVKGFHFADSRFRMKPSKNELELFSIKDNIINMPEIEINIPTNLDIPKLLHPTFNLIWNSAGFSKSLNYKNDGTWKLL